MTEKKYSIKELRSLCDNWIRNERPQYRTAKAFLAYLFDLSSQDNTEEFSWTGKINRDPKRQDYGLVPEHLSPSRQPQPIEEVEELTMQGKLKDDYEIDEDGHFLLYDYGKNKLNSLIRSHNDLLRQVQDLKREVQLLR